MLRPVTARLRSLSTQSRATCVRLGAPSHAGARHSARTLTTGAASKPNGSSASSSARPALLGFLGAAAAVLAYKLLTRENEEESSVGVRLPLLHGDAQQQRFPTWTMPSRAELLQRLASEPEYDLLIIGAGATGAGCALDAATRGLRVACVERDDFAAGTSSRSTKLVHGGVRYLEKAFLEADYEQYKLVREALHERATFLKIAPYLAYQLPIMLPIYKLWKVPYYWVGAKFYDLFAGGESLESSYFMTKTRALELFPMLKNDSLVGAIVYYDGAHNDSRMNTAMACTAIAHGAVVTNHTEVVGLLKNKEGKLSGAVIKDAITGKTFTVRCKGIINATGPFCDAIRQMDEPSTQAIVAPSAGVHIILPNYYAPANMGLVDPSTSDGRVIFFLPWQGNTIAGTTDSPTQVTANPEPSEADVQWILKEVEAYLSPDVKVRRGDVLAAWSGIRPLVRDPNAKNTAALVRNHMIHVSPSGLLTIAGGKWTTYRAMAEEAVDAAIRAFNLSPAGPCVTTKTLLIGSHHYSKTMYIKLIQHFGIETEIAKHLSESYGDRAWAVASLAATTGRRWPILGKRLAETYPYIEAEVRYAVRREYACTAIDVLARRTRLAFLNAQAAAEALPRVIEIMAEELKWDSARCKAEQVRGLQFLKTMGLGGSATSVGVGQAVSVSSHSRSRFSPEELATYRMGFAALDSDGDGAISRDDLDKALQRSSSPKGKIQLDQEQITAAIKEMDENKTGKIEFGEFLERLADIKENKEKTKLEKIMEEMDVLPVERSGGGV